MVAQLEVTMAAGDMAFVSAPHPLQCNVRHRRGSEDKPC